MAIGSKQGVTYYSDLQSMQSISTPIIDNNVRMGYKGHFVPNWSKYTVDFDTFGYGLKKDRANQGSIVCSDASKLFSLTKGYVGMVLSFPDNFYSGIYYPLLNSTADIREHLLWGVNVGQVRPFMPSVYASLTHQGIEFTVWSTYVKYTLTDSFSNLPADTNVFMEFIWDSNGFLEYTTDEGYKPTMCIRINSQDIVLGNPPIANNSISGLPFNALETPSVYSNLECTIRRLVTGNEVPYTVEYEWYSSSSSSSSLSSASSSSMLEVTEIAYDDLTLSTIQNHPMMADAGYSSVAVEDDLLQFSDVERSFSYMWIPGASTDSISRLDLSDPTNPIEVGRYSTGAGSSKNPSRTAITALGDCWITNRGSGSVTIAIKIGNTDLGSCRNDCGTTSTGDGTATGATALPYGTDDATLLEFNKGGGGTVTLPGTGTPGSGQGTRGIVEDVNQHIWIQDGISASGSRWWEIVGDGGYNGSGSVTEHSSTGAERTYGAVCSFTNNHIWSVRHGYTHIDVFNADDPSENFVITQILSDAEKGTYGIAYARGYVYVAAWLNGGNVYRINADLATDPDPTTNFWNYTTKFIIPTGKVGGRMPRHFTVYTYDDNVVDADRTEDLFISYYSSGAIGILKDHKQYADGATVDLSAATTDKFSFHTNSDIAHQAGVGILRDTSNKPYAWVISHSTDKMAAWDIEEEEWITFQTGNTWVSAGGGSHYNYTNFTGTVDEVDVVPLYGNARYVIDSGSSGGASWQKVCITANIPSNTSITLLGAVSDNPSLFPPPQSLQDCVAFDLRGRYFELTIQFSRDSITDPSPSLKDFEITVGLP